jgi:hypothetical protein
MTAEELALTIYRPINMTCNEFAIKLAVEFAKIKVTEALKTASEKAECVNEGTYSSSGQAVDYYQVNKDSILNSYPLDQIK